MEWVFFLSLQMLYRLNTNHKRQKTNYSSEELQGDAKNNQDRLFFWTGITRITVIFNISRTDK